MTRNFFTGKSRPLSKFKGRLNTVSLAALSALGIETLKDFQSVTNLADGSVEVVLASGKTATFAASEVAIVAGQVYIAETAITAAGLTVGTGLSTVAIVAGGAAAAIGAGVAIGKTGDSNEAPIFSSPVSFSVTENQPTAFTANATDADGDTLSYSLAGPDASLFTINASTGVVSFVSNPDFETPGDANTDNVYTVSVTANDGSTSVSQTVNITVTDENETPQIVSVGSVSVAENESSVAQFSGTDVDGDTLTYSLSGADAALFAIDAATGVVTFSGAPDFEMPGDADGDSVYELTVTVSDGEVGDGELSSSQGIVVTVTDVNEAPVVASGPSFTAAAVTFIAAPDFETPGDADGDNVYDVTVTASDGTLSSAQDVSITVTDVNEAPVVTSGPSFTAAENQSSAFTATATDVDGDTLTYSLSGIDAALFAIDATTGVVTFIEAPDFETPGDADGDNVYDVTVTASDGARSTSQDISVTITGVNEAPAFTSTNAVASIDEGLVSAFTASPTDVDGDVLLFSLSGADAALFVIDQATGAVSFVDAPDFENPTDVGGDNNYDFTVSVSDGEISADQSVTLSVVDTDDILIVGSEGPDGIDFSAQTESIEVDAGAGDDIVLTGVGEDNILTGDGRDIIATGMTTSSMQGKARIQLMAGQGMMFSLSLVVPKQMNIRNRVFPIRRGLELMLARLRRSRM